MFLLTDGYTTQKMLLKWKKGFDQSKVRKCKVINVLSNVHFLLFDEDSTLSSERLSMTKLDVYLLNVLFFLTFLYKLTRNITCS